MLHYKKTRLIVRRTKIVATIGPASSPPHILEKLIRSGMNVARLNFSHGDIESHQKVVHTIREISRRLNCHVAILGDLCGPKIRVGNFEEGQIELKNGDIVTVVTTNVMGKPGLIPSQYKALVQDVQVGQKILLDDGKMEMKVVSIDSDSQMKCRIVHGGFLKNNKGMNVPEAALSVPALTKKDHEFLEFAIRNDLEYVALSFVRKAEEIVYLQKEIERLTHLEAEENSAINPNYLTRVIAKIEKPQALDEIEEIIDQSDGIMVARGDLGVEMPLQDVPIIQNQLIRMTNRRNKPVIVATQMLESMVECARPTRAEVSDVAGAVFGSADAVMLSGETASGNYPVESVAMMDSVLREVENYQWAEDKFGRLQSDVSIYPLPNAVARACTLLSQDMEIRAANIVTRGGSTVKMLSSSRPNAPIVAYSPFKKLLNQILLHWGVVPILMQDGLSLEDFTEFANKSVKNMGIAKEDNYVLLVSNPVSPSGKKMTSIRLYQIS